MERLITSHGDVFSVEWASSSSLTEHITFYAKILNTDISTVNEAFSDPDNLNELIVDVADELESEINPDNIINIFTGYVRYTGFSLNPDDSITVTLKRNVTIVE